MSDVDITRAASIAPARSGDIPVCAVVRWVADEVRVEPDEALPDDCIAAVQLALVPHRRRQIGAPVETLDGRWLVHLDNILAPADRAAESVCECSTCPGVWVSVKRRDPHWRDIIGTRCPSVPDHTMIATPLGLQLLASAGLTVGDDGRVVLPVTS